MKATELISKLQFLIENYGDLEVVHFIKDPDLDVGIDIIRNCNYEPSIDIDYYDMRKDRSNIKVFSIY